MASRRKNKVFDEKTINGILNLSLDSKRASAGYAINSRINPDWGSSRNVLFPQMLISRWANIGCWAGYSDVRSYLMASDEELLNLQNFGVACLEFTQHLRVRCGLTDENGELKKNG